MLLIAAAAAIALVLVGPAGAHRDDHRSGDDPAGTIASFSSDNGKLTIDLAEGGSIAGTVTRRTWIESGDECDRDRRTLSDWCRRLSHGDAGDDDHGSHHGSDGDLDDLVAGATVHDALLVLTDGRAVFAKIELED